MMIFWLLAVFILTGFLGRNTNFALCIKDRYEKIKIIRVKKEQIIEQLKSRGYPEIDGTYDYLIKMHIYNLSEDKIEELQKMIENKTRDLEEINCETYVTLWTKELTDLDLKSLIKCAMDDENKLKNKPKKKIKKIKKKN